MNPESKLVGFWHADFPVTYVGRPIAKKLGVGTGFLLHGGHVGMVEFHDGVGERCGGAFLEDGPCSRFRHVLEGGSRGGSHLGVPACHALEDGKPEGFPAR